MKNMTLQQAISTLEYYQRWRKGADIPQPNPKEISEAIDISINLMKGMKL